MGRQNKLTLGHKVMQIKFFIDLVDAYFTGKSPATEKMNALKTIADQLRSQQSLAPNDDVPDKYKKAISTIVHSTSQPQKDSETQKTISALKIELDKQAIFWLLVHESSYYYGGCLADVFEEGFRRHPRYDKTKNIVNYVGNNVSPPHLGKGLRLLYWDHNRRNEKPYNCIRVGEIVINVFLLSLVRASPLVLPSFSHIKEEKISPYLKDKPQELDLIVGILEPNKKRRLAHQQIESGLKKMGSRVMYREFLLGKESDFKDKFLSEKEIDELLRPIFEACRKKGTIYDVRFLLDDVSHSLDNLLDMAPSAVQKAVRDNPEDVNETFKNHKDERYRGSLPLTLCIKENKIELAQVLLENHADYLNFMYEKGKKTKTPLDWAIEGGNPEVLSLLGRSIILQGDIDSLGRLTPLAKDSKVDLLALMRFSLSEGKKQQNNLSKKTLTLYERKIPGLLLSVAIQYHKEEVAIALLQEHPRILSMEGGLYNRANEQGLQKVQAEIKKLVRKGVLQKFNSLEDEMKNIADYANHNPEIIKDDYLTTLLIHCVFSYRGPDKALDFCDNLIADDGTNETKEAARYEKANLIFLHKIELPVLTRAVLAYQYVLESETPTLIHLRQKFDSIFQGDGLVVRKESDQTKPWTIEALQTFIKVYPANYGATPRGVLKLIIEKQQQLLLSQYEIHRANLPKEHVNRSSHQKNDHTFFNGTAKEEGENGEKSNMTQETTTKKRKSNP